MALQQDGALLGMEMKALEGISPEQLATIARLFQNGTLPVPPPPPGAPQAIAVPTPTAPPSAPPAAIAPAPNHTPQQDVDMDKEDGELEEGEVGDSAARPFLRTPPKGPRNSSRSPHPRGAARSSRPSQSQRVRSSQPGQTQQVNGGGRFKSKSHDTVKAFVIEMHRAGYGFERVSQEVTNIKALRNMYHKLGLPMAPLNPAMALVGISPLVADDQRKTSASKRPAPAKAPAPQDRSEYLAKLQAAKNKRPEQVAPAASLTKMPPKASSPALPISVEAPTPTVPITPVAASPITPKPAASKVAAKTDIIRQRLEALKAENAAKQNAAKQSNDGPVSFSPAMKPGLGHGLADAGTRAANEAATHTNSSLHATAARARPPPPSNAAAFPSVPPSPAQLPPNNTGYNLPGLSPLPGLFMTKAPLSTLATQQQTVKPFIAHQPAPPTRSNTSAQSPAAPSAQLQIPRQRPVAAATSCMNRLGAQGRLYDQSHGEYAEEPFVIVDSDDDSDNDMELDDDTEQGIPATRAQLSLKDFPPNFNINRPSAVSTPGTPNTPNAELKRKMEEIEEHKRMIAEKERQNRQKVTKPKRTNETSLASSMPGLQTGVLPAAPSSVSASEAATPPAQDPPQTIALALPVNTAAAQRTTEASQSAGANTARPSSSTPTSALALQREQEKVSLRRRLQELKLQRDQMASSAVTHPSHQSRNAALSSGIPDPPISIDELQPVPAELPEPFTEASNDDDDGDDEGEIQDNADDIVSNDTAISADARQVGSHANTVLDVAENPIILPGEHIAANADDLVLRHDIAVVEMIDCVESQLLVNGEDEEDDEEYIPGSTHEGVSVIDRAPSLVTQETDADENEDEDEDDLDDIYAEGTPVQATPLPAINNSAASPEDEDDGSDSAMDTSGDSSEGSEDDDADSDQEPAVELEPVSVSVSPPLHVSHTTNVSPMPEEEQPAIADDLVREIQPLAIEYAEPKHKKSSFTPYESPLRCFKDYRYHTEFLATTPSGYKSLTYSSKIDPVKTICPYETGGICNDENCEYQHFKTMVLNDNDLLRLMGHEKTPARTPEEEKKWRDGLGVVIKELRDKGLGKDVDAIAHRIAQYRREFVEDPTKTLLFD